MTAGDLVSAASQQAGGDRWRYFRQTCELLWPPPAAVCVVSAAPWQRLARPGAPGAGAEHILLLGPQRPRLMVPASPAAAAAAVRGYGQPRSRAGRLGARALAAAMGAGIGGALAPSRVLVQAPAGADTVESFLRDALGCPLVISMYLGAARANRKPVLQLLTPGGGPVGFAKIGVNALTRKLVEAEKQALTALAEAELGNVVAPRVLYYGEWRQMNVLVISALPVWQRHRPVPAAQLAAGMQAVAGVGGIRTGALGGSAYYRNLTARLAAADQSDARDQLRSVLDLLPARAGATPLRFGSWHGDWTPWNMAGTRAGLLVWDWERFAQGVPVGFDALHHRLQRDVGTRRRDPRSAADACIGASPGLLAPFGTDPAAARVTSILYLADLATRYLADRQAQAGARNGRAGSWLVPAIASAAARL